MPLRTTISLAAAAMTLAGAWAGSAAAQPYWPQPLPQQQAGRAPLVWPGSGAVARYYEARQNAPIWFRGGTRSSAATQLMTILQRSRLDGFQTGPALAAQVQNAIREAQSGSPAAIQQAERLLSTAWVGYVQALRAPVPGIVYGTEAALQPTAVDRILYEAANAPSLTTHLTQVSSVNPIYAQLRDAAWSQAQYTGGVPEPRLAANLARARVFPATGRFVMVDVATQRLFMMEDGRVRDSMKVVVGKPDHQTPLIASVIYYATFNPYWNAPESLVREKVAPGVIREGFKYLDDRGYDVMANWREDSPIVSPSVIDWRAVAAGRQTVRLRKRPHGANPMGAIKIPFPNNLDIYLHDTFERDLFAKDSRALSLGCIRLENAQRLTRWLGLSPVAPSSKPELQVGLPAGVPIYLTYLTARAEGGQLTFAPDVYGIDRVAYAQFAR